MFHINFMEGRGISSYVCVSNEKVLEKTCIRSEADRRDVRDAVQLWVDGELLCGQF